MGGKRARRRILDLRKAEEVVEMDPACVYLRTWNIAEGGEISVINEDTVELQRRVLGNEEERKSRCLERRPFAKWSEAFGKPGLDEGQSGTDEDIHIATYLLTCLCGLRSSPGKLLDGRYQHRRVFMISSKQNRCSCLVKGCGHADDEGCTAAGVLGKRACRQIATYLCKQKEMNRRPLGAI